MPSRSAPQSGGGSIDNVTRPPEMILLEGVFVLAFALLIALPSLYYAFLAAITLLPRRGHRRAIPEALRSSSPSWSLPTTEELVIARTIAALLRLDYPRQHFSVHLVADNCTDATAAAARSAGACVHERNDQRSRGKGAALNWLLEQNRDRSPRPRRVRRPWTPTANCRRTFCP